MGAVGGERVGGERAGGERAGGERAGGERAGGERAGGERGRDSDAGAQSFDGVVEQAWWRYEANLTAHLFSMAEGAYITITSAQASTGQRGLRPYVDLAAVASGRVIGIAALPSYLYPTLTAGDSADAELHRLGWTEPGKPTADGAVMDYTTAVTRAESGRLAAQAVSTLRGVWHVPHPSFLSAWIVGAGGSETGPAQLGDVPPIPEQPPREPKDTMPRAGSLPVALRSLHTFCELLGAAVDDATVRSVCGPDDLDTLSASAYEHANRCAEFANRMRGRRSSAAQVWAQQARSWLHTAESLRAAALLRTDEHTTKLGRSGPDSAAKSAGS